MTRAQALFDEAFSKPRDPSSQEYKDGMLAALKLLFREAGEMRCPYKVGTVMTDAWYAGATEGRCRWRDHLFGSLGLAGERKEKCRYH
ncbi:MAG: hypothetical protein A2514_07885 [Gammaproteobacteria bacterium RIFOXYD12_FULL_61_37]|nr:MAG: hypothetical protein A2514_07885 [Gammaproteobacteria bacterium RIFOXYD12_FULL_61_37]